LVAGTMALLRQSFPTMDPSTLARRLQQNSTTLCGTQLPSLDAAAALGAKAQPRKQCQ
jgi:hypothetical protein